MAHILKEKWHSYLVGTNQAGSAADIQADGADHVMDLTKISDTGVLDDGTHNGNLLKGNATQVGATTYFIALDEYEGGAVTRHYEGFLVRNKSIGGFTLKLLAGRYIIFHKVQFAEKIGPLLAEQEEGTWVATKP